MLFAVLLLSQGIVFAKNPPKPKPLYEPISMGATKRDPRYKIILKQELHDAVDKQFERYQQDRMLKFLRDSLERAEPYLSYIMERIDYYGLPRELIYLPVVESGYRFSAVSRAGATGMWQFMRTSALPYGLIIDEWRDDRLDVYLSTDAALRKIRDEMDLLGDPLLAIAAYNGGITRVRRQQRHLTGKGITPSFWSMYDERLLPRETSEYVPQLLAIARLMEKPRRYGLKPIRWKPQGLNTGKKKTFIEFELEKQINLELIAKDVGIDVTELFFLNQSLKKGITPPTAKGRSFVMRLPTAHAPALTDAILASDWVPNLYIKYRVKKGDSFARIASRHSITTQELIAANPRKNPRLIHPGEILNIPIS
ncbi:transglycosylase SLT domain-containing protein [Entomospira entomophila]|uniref:Transglycosylase SLT domain-containing protein n=2 Tax=Entomospira entomophila TaxID=2719988 RepID=A0A968KSE8_9SPIO|nr:transglycosylase SLT domain-containing protein [Entomospira entomophilus]NIZ40277.1 transglycosylase SLT domain-containing protein [Entomospira entomophilus]